MRASEPTSVSVGALIGVGIGASAAVVLLFIVGCVCLRLCAKKAMAPREDYRRPKLPGPTQVVITRAATPGTRVGGDVSMVNHTHAEPDTRKSSNNSLVGAPSASGTSMEAETRL